MQYPSYTSHPLDALCRILFLHIMYKPRSPKGLENLIILALYRSTGRRFTASAQALNDNCCDHKIFRSRDLFEIQNTSKSEYSTFGFIESIHAEDIAFFALH